MATIDLDDLDLQASPAKRPRLDNELSQTDPLATMNDMNDLVSPEEKPNAQASVLEVPVHRSSSTEAATPMPSMIPGLGRLGNASKAPEKITEIMPPASAERVKEDAAELLATGTLNLEMSDVKDGPTATNSEMPRNEKSSPSSEPQCSEKMDVDVAETSSISTGSGSASSVPGVASLDNPQIKPITHALEALLGGLDPPVAKAAEAGSELAEVPAADENPEWEIDSSPYESSSDDSSSDDSSDDDSEEDGDNAYKLLSPEEQARILMEGDGGSEDEGGATKTKGPGGQLRTKNEIPEEIIPKPDVIVTPEMQIEELGVVETVVENIVLIKAKTSGEYRALESGSVLCLADRSVFGVVSETLGRVQQPLYTVRFTNGEEITEAGLSIGTKVFYSEQHAKFALTQTLKAYKGSDASNLHDEEVGDEEIEFSDDEAEAEHKRRIKQKKLTKRGGKGQSEGYGRAGPHGHPLQQQQINHDSGGLNYDDAEDDGPYKLLARPSGFADNVGRGEAPQERDYLPGMPNRGRGDFRGRGRGDRGRGRGDRGRGRGGFSKSPQSHLQHGLVPPQTIPPYSTGAAFPQSLPGPPSTTNFYNPQSQGQYAQSPAGSPSTNNAYNSQQQGRPFPPDSAWAQVPQPPHAALQMGYGGWTQMASSVPAGFFINPAMLQGTKQGPPNQGPQGQQNMRGRGSPF